MEHAKPHEIKAITASFIANRPGVDAVQLDRYVADVLTWNPAAGLVSKQNPPDTIGRLLRQSAHLCDVLIPRTEASWGRPLRVVDIGSGGGFPGIVWKLLMPDWEFLLIDRRAKKAAFLERVVRVLDLEDVEVVGDDAMRVAGLPEYEARYDAAATMAVGPPGETGPLVEGFLRPGGLFATTVPRDTDPPDRAGSALRLLDVDRHEGAGYAVYQKTS